MLVLFTIPLLARLLLSSSESFQNIILTFVPFLTLVPCTFLPKYIKCEETEHVIRHFLFSVTFLLAAVCIDWNIPDTNEAQILGAYFIIGGFTLFWFTFSHVVENYYDKDTKIFTHQGDVAVLPLTLFSIGIISNMISEDVFRFSRSIIYYIPIIVGWATLFFIAFNNFAIRRITTYNEPQYSYVAKQSFLISSAHLLLLEVRAHAIYYILFPFIAAINIQLAPPFELRTVVIHTLRKRLFVSLSISLVTATIGYFYFGLLSYYVIPISSVLFLEYSSMENKYPVYGILCFLTTAIFNAYNIYNINVYLLTFALYGINFETYNFFIH